MKNLKHFLKKNLSPFEWAFKKPYYQLRFFLLSIGRKTKVKPRGLIVGLGAQKAGTTSLYDFLSSLPAVAPPLVRKEQHYFSTISRVRMEIFSKFFRDSGGRYLLDITPAYAISNRAIENIAAIEIEKYLIYVIRNPLERIISHYRHNKRLGLEKLPLKEALENEVRNFDRWKAESKDLMSKDFQNKTYLFKCAYQSHLEYIVNKIPARSICVVSFDALVNDPDTTLSAISSWLNLDFPAGFTLKLKNPGVGKSVDTAAIEHYLADYMKDFYDMETFCTNHGIHYLC